MVVGSSRGDSAPMTADVRRVPRRGTPSACATKRMHPTQAREIVASARGRVLHSVRRPVHVDPHYAPQVQTSEVGHTIFASRLGKLTQVRGTSTGVESSGRSAARRVSLSAQVEGVARRRKGRRSRSPSLRGSKEPGFGCPHVVSAVAEVSRLRLVSNKLGKRAPKRAVRVE